MNTILKIFLLICLSFPIQVFSCDFIPETFCKTIEINSDNLVVHGIIISKDQNGLDLEVIDVLRGSETKVQIRIWDGTDFDCNGNHDMSTNTIGEIGDSIIISLPQIEEIENNWDVIGDYRRPNPYIYTPELLIENGIAQGLIKGDATFPPEQNLLSIDVNKIKNAILSNDNCSDIQLSTQYIKSQKIEVLPNPVSSILTVKVPKSGSFHSLSIYNLQGNEILKKSFPASNTLEVNTAHFPNGLYYVKLEKRNKKYEMVKVIKN